MKGIDFMINTTELITCILSIISLYITSSVTIAIAVNNKEALENHLTHKNTSFSGVLRLKNLFSLITTICAILISVIIWIYKLPSDTLLNLSTLIKLIPLKKSCFSNIFFTYSYIIGILCSIFIVSILISWFKCSKSDIYRRIEFITLTVITSFILMWTNYFLSKWLISLKIKATNSIVDKLIMLGFTNLMVYMFLAIVFIFIYSVSLHDKEKAETQPN